MGGRFGRRTIRDWYQRCTVAAHGKRELAQGEPTLEGKRALGVLATPRFIAQLADDEQFRLDSDRVLSRNEFKRFC